jgi:hypothetical protein
MVVVATLKQHVANFSIEFDQYMTILAVNKGSLAAREEFTSGEKFSPAQLLANKKSMTRDMSLSWRMDRFFLEVRRVKCHSLHQLMLRCDICGML